MDCKYCRSPNVIKFGQVKGVQRYFCKSCRRKFVSGDTIPKMQTPTKIIADALNMYYQGLSETRIRRNLSQEHSTIVSTGSIYNWVTRFADLAEREAFNHVPKVGREWVADETLLILVGESVCFWDLIDKETHFLLASHMSLTRSALDAQELMKPALKWTKTVPRIIYTDKLASYLAGMPLIEDIKHERSSLFHIQNDSRLIEHFHAAFRERSRVMHRLRNLNTIRRFMGGWLVHYNFFRPNAFLTGKTPAEVAGIKFPFRNWREVVEQPYAKTSRIFIGR